MPGQVEDLIIRIGISGQDDVIGALRAVAEAAEEQGKRLAESFGGGGIAELGLAITGAAVGFGVLVEHANEAGAEMEKFAAQTGESVESISSLETAVVDMGGSLQGIEGAFRRLAATAGRTWDEIKKQARDAKDVQINDNLAVQKADQDLFHARQKFAQDMAAAGRPTGILPPTPIESQLEAQREAQTTYDKAVQASAEAQKKADIDRLNDINNVAAAVQRVVKGEQTVAEASKSANLEVSNVFKGLVAGATPGAIEGLKNVSTNMNELAGQSPKVRELFLNLADFMQKSGDATLNTELALHAFGRAMGSQLIVPLQQGRAAIEENIAAAQRFGLAISDDRGKKAEDFHQAYNRLTGDLSTSLTQVGIAFGPGFTEGMKDWNKFFEENHKALQTWVEGIAKEATPAIKEFFDALTGLAAAISGGKLDPQSDAQKWKESWQPVVQLFSGLKEILQDVGKALNGITDLSQKGANYLRSLVGLPPTGGAAGAATGTEKPGEQLGQDQNTQATSANTSATDKNTSAHGKTATSTDRNTAAIDHLITVMTPARGPGAPRTTQVETIDTMGPGERRTSGRALFVTPPEPGAGLAPPGARTVPGPTASTPVPVTVVGPTGRAAEVGPAGLQPGQTATGETAVAPLFSPNAMKTLFGILGAGIGGGIATPFTGGFGTAAAAAAGAYGGEAAYEHLDQAGAKLQAAATTLQTAAQQVAQRGGPESVAIGGDLGGDAQELPRLTQAFTTTLDQVVGDLSSLAGALVSAAQAAQKASEAGGAGGGTWRGGLIRLYQGGGHIQGRGTETSDEIPIMASNNEFMMQAKATNFYGTGTMHLINEMKIPKPHLQHHLALGGLIDAMATPIRSYQGGGAIHAAPAAPAASGRPLTLVIGEHKVSGLTATEAASKQISHIATMNAVRSGGARPDWYR